MSKEVCLTTDGSCLGNPGPGGWAALLRYKQQEKLLSGAEANTTNNRMELTAVIEGLKALKEPCLVEVVTDSQYIINAFEKGWLSSWQKNGWKTANKKPVKNQDLWIEFYDHFLRHKIKWIWVKGHSGHPDNEIVDEAARQAALLLVRS
jgi:ribonuclease HI